MKDLTQWACIVLRKHPSSTQLAEPLCPAYVLYMHSLDEKLPCYHSLHGVQAMSMHSFLLQLYARGAAPHGLHSWVLPVCPWSCCKGGCCICQRLTVTSSGSG